jgi:hypothetical protein
MAAAAEADDPGGLAATPAGPLRARAAAKEAFVAGLQGTTKWEVFCIIGCLPMCSLFGEKLRESWFPRLRTARPGSAVGLARSAAR